MGISADIRKNAKEWEDVYGNIRENAGKTLIFKVAMKYDTEGDIPLIVKKKYRRSYIFIIRTIGSYRPVFFCINKKLFKKRIKKIIPEQVMLVKGFVSKPFKVSRHRRGHIIKINDIMPFYNFVTVAEKDVNLSDYKKDELADIKLDYDKKINSKVILDERFGSLERLQKRLAARAGITDEEWARLYVVEDSRERLTFYINKESQVRYYELAKTLKYREKIKVYGRVVEFPDWDKDSAAIIVDKIIATERKNSDGEESPEKVAKKDDGIISTTEQELQSKIKKLNGEMATFTHTYRGHTKFPSSKTSKIKDIKGKKWFVLRNENTDLEGIFAIFEKGKDDIIEKLKKLELGDAFQVEGKVLIQSKNKIILITDVNSIPSD